MTERREHYQPNPEQHQERSSNGLPPELAEFLQRHQYAALFHPSEELGTVLVVKAPGQEIDSVRGTVPVELRHELYHHPLAPVVRVTTRIFDRPEAPLALETFINVADADQRTDYATLIEQEALYLLFYDERLQHRLTKHIDQDRSELQGLLDQADWLLQTIRPERLDFDQAKAEVMAATRL